MKGRWVTLLVAAGVLMVGAAACGQQPQVIEERQLQQEQQGLGGQQGQQTRQVLIAQQRQIEQLEQQVAELEEQINELEQRDSGDGFFGGGSGDGIFEGSSSNEDQQLFEDQQRRLDDLERQLQEQE